MQIYPHGNPECPIWVIVEKPLPRDFERGYLFSSSLGWHFFKMWTEAGLPDPYVTCLKPDDSLTYNEDTLVSEFINNNCLSSIFIGQKQPKFIVTIGADVTIRFVPSTAKRNSKKGVAPEASLDKWAGSLLTSPFIDYEHYLIPGYLPQDIISDWAYRDIFINIDLGHVRFEYEYWLLNGALKTLPIRELKTEPSYEDLMLFLTEAFDHAEYISNDIETIRPARKSSLFKYHPGVPYTNSFAISPEKSISFSLWNYPTNQLCSIWNLCDAIYREKKIIGQNFFEFDLHFLEAIGFRFCYDRIQDTKLRHHQLWVELPHTLQFLTRQYTREPFYKEEGHSWSPKNLKNLMRYNCKDTCCTYEVFLKQEEEFIDRPYLA